MATLHGNTIHIDGFDAYLTRPRPGVAVRGGILVIHEIWGLSEHIEAVADRFAAEGYVALAPDILTHAGIDPEAGAEIQQLLFGGDEAARSKAQPLLRERTAPTRDAAYAEWALGALRSAVDRLAQEEGVTRLASVGFCFGGTYTYALAAVEPRLAAAVPFYGEPPQTTDYTDFSCPILAFYGGTDQRLADGLPAVRQAMSEVGVDYTSRVYPDAGHAFFNDTNSHTYRPEDAADAWRRTLAFLAEKLDSARGGAEVLLDGFGRVRHVVHAVLDGIAEEDLTYRADPDANTIAWLVWHLSRGQDVQLAPLAGGTQVWNDAGFADRFALPFADKATGYGHTSADVAAVRAAAGLLLEYFDATYERVAAFLAGLVDTDLNRIIDTSWTPAVTLGVRLTSILSDDLQHAGQAAFLRGVAERRR